MVNKSQRKIRDKLGARRRRLVKSNLEAQRISEFEKLKSYNTLLKEKLTKFQSIKNQLDVNLDILKFEENKNVENDATQISPSDTANGEDKGKG
jgi:hypothetical protein